MFMRQFAHSVVYTRIFCGLQMHSTKTSNSHYGADPALTFCVSGILPSRPKAGLESRSHKISALLPDFLSQKTRKSFMASIESKLEAESSKLKGSSSPLSAFSFQLRDELGLRVRPALV